MSRALLVAKRDYLHSPVDDLESFFWVAIWSVLFNLKSGEKWDAEQRTKNALLKNQKDHAMTLFGDLIYNEQRNNVTRCFQNLIRDWWMKVQNKNQTWRDVASTLSNDAKQFQLQFHQFALQGVLDVLEVLGKHWEGSISWNSWTRPK